MTAAEKKERSAITGEAAPDGGEAVITNNLGYTAAQRRAVKGEAAKGAAASMVAVSSGAVSDFTILEDINLNQIAETAKKMASTYKEPGK